jgi:hypothetical protein
VQEARFLISQQKYLELLEARKTTAALQVLRNELAPLNVDPDQLHSLSRYILFVVISNAANNSLLPQFDNVFGARGS